MSRFVDSSGAPVTLQDDVAAVIEDPSRMPVLRDHLRQLGVPVPVGLVMMAPAPPSVREDSRPAPAHSPKPPPSLVAPEPAPSPLISLEPPPPPDASEPLPTRPRPVV